jgi:hypothetical protein
MAYETIFDFLDDSDSFVRELCGNALKLALHNTQNGVEGYKARKEMGPLITDCVQLLTTINQIRQKAEKGQDVETGSLVNLVRDLLNAHHSGRRWRITIPTLTLLRDVIYQGFSPMLAKLEDD